MLNPFKELFDNIAAEISLATANPSPELEASVKRAINNDDGDICAAFEDSTSWLGHGRILGDMEAAGLTIHDSVEKISRITGWPKDSVSKTVETQKIVLFLRKKMYTDAQIKRIGKISQGLKRNYNDIEKTAFECGENKDYVKKISDLLEEYKSDVNNNSQEKYNDSVSAQYELVGENKSDDNNPQEKYNDSVSVTYKNKGKYHEMMEEISHHKDFGKRNPVDIGIECGYSEADIMCMIQMLEKNA